MWLKCPDLCHFLSLFTASFWSLAEKKNQKPFSSTSGATSSEFQTLPCEKLRTAVPSSARSRVQRRYFNRLWQQPPSTEPEEPERVEIPPRNTREFCRTLRVLLLRFQGACRHIKASRAGASSSSSSSSGWGGASGGVGRGPRVRLRRRFAWSSATTERPHAAPTGFRFKLQEPLPLFKNVFVLLFFLGTM